MPKRILFICQRPPYPPNKGEKLRTYHQIKHLHALGCAISVACPIESEQDEADLLALKNVLAETVIFEPIQFPVVRKLLAFVQNTSISERFFYIKRLHQKIDALTQETSFDAVVLTASSLLSYAQNITAPKYMDFMDLDSDKWRQYADSSKWPLNWLYERESRQIQKLEVNATHSMEACYLIADKEIDLFRKTVDPSAQNLIKIRNGIDPSEFYPPENQRRVEIGEDPKFVFVGVMDYKPNEDAVMWFCQNVWADIRKAYPSARFNIVGMSPTKEVLALGQLGGVNVTGKVDSVLPYFHQADIFVAPFRLARGVQNKVLQSFATGLPVLTTPMGLEGIDGGVDGCSMTAQTPQAFLDASINLIEDNEKRSNMSLMGLALINEHYSWQAALEHFAPLVRTGQSS